jgi:hypothetical protein
VGNQATWQELKEQNYMQIKVLVIDKVLRNSFDYEMTPDELSKHGAALVDKTVELNIRDMSQNFAGRMRMSGAIIKVGA